MSYEAARKKKNSRTSSVSASVIVPQKGNFEQRKYEDEYLTVFMKMHKPYM